MSAFTANLREKGKKATLVSFQLINVLTVELIVALIVQSGYFYRSVVELLYGSSYLPSFDSLRMVKRYSSQLLIAWIVRGFAPAFIRLGWLGDSSQLLIRLGWL